LPLHWDEFHLYPCLLRKEFPEINGDASKISAFIVKGERSVIFIEGYSKMLRKDKNRQNQKEKSNAPDPITPLLCSDFTIL